MRNLTKIALIMVVCLLPLGNVFAQGTEGALTGTVYDSSGAAVAGAAIVVSNAATGASWSIKTSSAGYYRLPVPPGTYHLEAQVEGFKKSVADNIVVPVEQVVTIDFTLQVGNKAEAVTVTTEAPLITTSSAEVGASITPQEFQTLPIPLDDGGRQAQSFIFKSLPGAVGDSYQGSINGGQQFSHNILIDGVTIGRYDMSGGAMDEFHPGTDAIGEFKVQMSNYSAEYGESGGAIVNFSMKSGTNQFHGTGFEYNKNPVFNAAGVLVDSSPGTPKTNEKENNFGGTIGGPIRKDKTFFFFSYEGDRFTNFSFGSRTTIPTPAMRKGDFSSFLGAQVGTDALGRPIFTNEIYDPTSTRTVSAGQVDPVTGLTATANATIRDPFPGNVIPAGDFSKATSVLLPLFPDPLFSGDIRNTLRIAPSTPVLDRNAYNVKVDQVISDTQRINGFFGYYKRVLWKRNTSDSVYPPFPSQPISTYKNQDVIGPQAHLQDSWTVNDHSVNIATLAYNRTNNANNLTTNAKYTAQLGIPGIPDTCFPRTSFSVGSNKHIQFMSALGVACANIDPSESYIGQDVYTTTHGRHSFKIGGDFTRYRYDTDEPGPQSGSFSFNSKETSLPGFPTSTGHPFASWIMGAADGANRSVYATEPGYRSGVLAVFFQDDWKATSKLTLNLGLRWELPLPKTEAFNRQSGFDPTAPNPGADNIPGALVFLGNCSGCINRTSFQDWYFKEFGPRLGVAYAINKNLVFRGGYGISYGPPILNNFGSQNIFGFNSAITVRRKTGTSSVDPVDYLSQLNGAALPANANVGIPPFTGTLPNRDPASANGNTLDFYTHNSLAQPYVQNWSLGFQYQLPHEVVLEANYVGSKGTRLLDSNFSTAFNSINTKFMSLGDNLDMDFQDALNAGILQPYGITKLPYPDFENNNWDTSVAAGLAPYPQYFSLTNNYPTMGSSSYHALQVTARKNSTHGLTFIAAYTFSKTIDDTDTALYYPSYAVQDFYNRKLEKSIASFDHPQSLKLTWIYSLPIGHGQRWLSSSGVMDRLFSGWQVTSIQQYLSGDPLFVSSSLNVGLANGANLIPGIRADVISGVPQEVASSGLDVVNGTPYLNPAAFADPPATPNGNYPLRIGTGPRYLPQTRGPFQLNEDLGIIKNTRINEKVTGQIRCDMFNVFNRVVRGDPDTSLGDGLPSQGGTFGLITGPGNGPRVIQFALRVNF
ncbi:MAG TPA: TonB-dependent receptor [Terriglobia bacterium]|nr:TonB-dependent receptor [Terriglobia bacterium]